MCPDNGIVDDDDDDDDVGLTVLGCRADRLGTNRNGIACQCLGVLTCALLWMHETAHRGCTNTVRVRTERYQWEKNPSPHPGIEPASVLLLAFLLRYMRQRQLDDAI